MKSVLSGNARHERKSIDMGGGCLDELPHGHGGVALSLSPVHHVWFSPGTTGAVAGWDSSAHWQSLGIWGAFWSRTCAMAAAAGCWLSVRHWNVGAWDCRWCPGEVWSLINPQETGKHFHSTEGALEATFPFPKGLGHVWEGNSLLIRCCSVQIHSCAHIERTTL